MTHPFLQEDIHFESYQPQHIVPDVLEAIQRTKQSITKILQIKPEDRTFDNTIKAFDFGLYPLRNVMYILNILTSCRQDNEEYIKANDEIFAQQAEFRASLYTNKQLFEAINTIYTKRHEMNLENDQIKLTEEIYDDFIAGGGMLNEEQQKQLVELKKEICDLCNKCLKNITNGRNSYHLVIKDINELEGIPQYAIDMYKKEAEKRGIEGYVITLDYPSYGPVMRFCKNEKVRKELFLNANKQSSFGEFDNTEIINTIMRKRHEQAQLLGFRNFSQFITKRMMIGTDENAIQFVKQIRDAAYPYFEKEVEEIRQWKREHMNNEELMPWDTTFISERIKEEQYEFNENEVRKYLPLPVCFKVLFEVYRRLYGLTFKLREDVVGWHEECQYYEIYDNEENGKQLLGGVYFDMYTRKGKINGAFHNILRISHVNEEGRKILPIGVVVCNFSQPGKDGITYLVHDEMRTFFHESGHLMHTMLSKQRYGSLHGMSVYWDFVELPSKLMENFIYERETFDLFKTLGNIEPLPDELLQKIKRSRTYHNGMFCVRQMSLAKMDLELHQTYIGSNQSLDDFIEEKTKDYNVQYPIKTLSIIRHFKHLFLLTYCYASGYYSYMWAEHLEADAFEHFKENGVFNKEISEKFRKTILEMGGAKNPNDLFVEFRGRKPTIDALMRKMGFN